MKISNEIRVGLMFLVGVILLILLIRTLNQWGQDRNTYEFTIVFRQAQGILNGAAVQVAGVEMGRVTAVGLEPGTNQAMITVRVKEDVVLYHHYLYSIGIGGLVGERFVDIRPIGEERGKLVRPHDKVQGTTTPDINDVLIQSAELVEKLSETVDSVNVTLNNEANQRNLRVSLENLRTTSENAARFTEGLNTTLARNQVSIDLIVGNLQLVSEDARRASRSIASQVEGTPVFSNLEEATVNVLRVTERAESIARTVEVLIGDREIANNVREATRRLRQASGDLELMLADAREAVSGFPQVTANLQKASADLPEITRPFREVAPETATNLRDISRRLKGASESFGGIAQQVSRLGGVLANTRFEPEARLLTLPDGENATRSDINLNVRSGNLLFRAGAADIGNNTRLNVQMGNRVGDDLWLRYGMVESRFGAGADYQLSPSLRLTGELFDPENLRANASLDFRLPFFDQSLWLTSGWYNLFDRSTFGVGVTYRP